MRKGKKQSSSKYKILVVDDEIGVIESISIIFGKSGYLITGITNPLEAVERVRNEHFDMLILDFLMSPIHGDRLVELIREFNKEIYILLLTGYKDLAPPLQTIKMLDIQGYCEKSNRSDQLVLLVESGIKSITQKYAIKRIKDGLKAILQSVPNIYQLKPIGEIMDEVLNGIIADTFPISNSGNAFILLDDLGLDGGTQNVGVYHGTGCYNFDTGDFIGKLSQELLEQIGAARATRRLIPLEGGLILPLVGVDMDTIGVLFLEMDEIPENMELVEIYVSQVAASLNNAFLHSKINMKNVELGRAYELLKRHYMDMIETLRTVVDAKDVYTRGHSDRVSFFSVKIGEGLGLGADELETLRIGGLFHDIGKISTADKILLKPGRLDQEEYEEIKKHPINGAHILSTVSLFKDIVPMIRYHHERIDGRGYPDGLQGDEIPFFAKIVSVADAFDAMTSDRNYRPRITMKQTIEQLKTGAGTQFDIDVVDTFVGLTSDYDSLIAESKKLLTLWKSRNT